MIKKICVVFGTRPEAIKMCPLVIALKKSTAFNTVVCVTGQHKDMLDSVLDVFGIEPDINFSIMSEKQDLFEITNRILVKAKSTFLEIKPDLVLVHGDTSTAFAISLASFYLKIPVGHVEAGLRTYNINSPFPEELNRQAISIISSYNFAPTEIAKNNLLNENRHNVFVTGNTGIDALKYTINESFDNEYLRWATEENRKLILITAHRRENIGKPMRNMFRAIRRVLEENKDIRAIYPIHMNPVVRKIAQEELADCDEIKIIAPLDVISFHNFMKKAYLILTDSGGIQEEAPALGKPVLVMRDTTERPEGVEAGTLRLVGTEEENIYCEFKRLVTDNAEYQKMAKARSPYGDGFASERIVRIIEESILV